MRGKTLVTGTGISQVEMSLDEALQRTFRIMSGLI